MFTYERRACYHETDQMGVIHHSNYLKWMEEARIHLLDHCGFSYKFMEENGIISPVTNISIDYKVSCLFDSIAVISVKITEYSGVKMTLEYEIYNKETKEIYAKASSKHCFIKDKKIVSLKRALPEAHQRMVDFIASF